MSECDPTIDLNDVLLHIDRALAGMARTLRGLDDATANSRPALNGANSPVQIVVHCLGVIEFWCGHVIAGRDVERDRAAEFTASHPVIDVLDAMAAAKRRMGTDLSRFDGFAPPAQPPTDCTDAFVRSQGGVLMHVYEELAQHRGHLDITADLLTQAQ